MSKAKELLFRVTIKDCVVETFRAGGPGGQHQNKTETGVRVKHPASGAVGESREYKSQLSNKQAAFKRMAESAEFKKWHKIETSKHLGTLIQIEKAVDEAMHQSNLRVEYKVDGKWQKLGDAYLQPKEQNNE